ncbi:MarR family winged helix-turn-helix transcriptional regulator [Actinophytocola xinjiangensis]|uniref:MarR family winged helix-turn-helix transcriptional regulator n=1 Tax=Actinophytocola xinjiangensis TaxID=485602 RepID=UPI0012B98BD4|nr:MarR family transcriptional regulator [Actinophytocola xinjiangensis]
MSSRNGDAAPGTRDAWSVAVITGDEPERVLIGRRLVQLAQVIVRLEELSLHKLDLSYRQMRILKHVNAGVSSARDLAQFFGITPPAISETLEALVRRDLLVREPNPNDRRAVVLRLTAAGAKLCQRSQLAEDELAEDMLTTLDQQGVEDLGALLANLLAPNQERLLSQRRDRDTRRRGDTVRT